MKSIKEIVAENIRKRRIELSLTQSELAEKAKIHTVTVARIENKTRGAGDDVLKALAKALRCSVNDLYGNEKKVESLGELGDLTLAELINEVKRFRSLPLYRHLMNADDAQLREYSDLVVGYIQAPSKEKLGAFQILSPRPIGGELGVSEDESHPTSTSQSRAPKVR